MHCSIFVAKLNRARITQSIMELHNDEATDNISYTRCAQQVHFLHQALSGKRVRPYVSGHSSLGALCLLALSEGGQ